MNVRLWGAIVVLTLLISPLEAAPAPDPRLKAIDATASFPDTDFKARYTIVQRKANQGNSVTVLDMYRRDAVNQYVLVLQEPAADRGKGVLQTGSLVRKYNPVDKRFDLTSSKDQLRNSSVRLSDFQGATFARDYRVTAQANEKLGKAGSKQLDTTVLTLEASNDQVSFPKVKLWVTADNLIRARADYSLSGQLLRTTGVTEYTKVGARAVPTAMVIVDELRGQEVNGTLVKDRTVVTIASPEFLKLDNLTFSDAFLVGLPQ